eukprot:9306558-Ditylum_brightwellii.AAC.1
MITKAPWIPQMHLEQIQKVMSTMAKLSTNHPMLKQVMDSKGISPDVLRTINDAASEMIRDNNCCCEIETLEQVFFQSPPSHKKRPAEQNQDDSKQSKKQKITNNSKSEKAKKNEEAEKEGWLEKSSKYMFAPPL